MQKSQILDLVATYLAKYPGEQERLQEFTAYLATNDALFDRKNFNGHITTSAVVFDPTRSRILLIVHKTLGRFLQPGGHFENDSSLTASAAREVLEETGVSVDPHPLGDGDHPIDIDAHWMPANARKQEDAHWHFDFRYLFTSTHARDFSLQEEEVTGCAWHALDSAEAKSCFGPYCWQKLLLL